MSFRKPFLLKYILYSDSTNFPLPPPSNLSFLPDLAFDFISHTHIYIHYLQYIYNYISTIYVYIWICIWYSYNFCFFFLWCLLLPLCAAAMKPLPLNCPPCLPVNNSLSFPPSLFPFPHCLHCTFSPLNTVPYLQMHSLGVDHSSSGDWAL